MGAQHRTDEVGAAAFGADQEYVVQVDSVWRDRRWRPITIVTTVPKELACAEIKVSKTRRPAMNRRKIIAIAGSGRTGSTLLSLLLTQHKSVFNLAQLRDLWSACQADAPCTCGERLASCPIWSSVITAVFGSDPTAGLAAMSGAQKRFFVDAARQRDWGDASRTGALAGRHGSYLEQLAAVLDALQAVTGAAAFVDASKSPEMALALSLTAGADARVLNLARDPRAVAVSWRQRRGSVAAAWKFGRVWAERQRVLEVWSRCLGNRFRMVRYEVFAAEPQRTIEDILAWADLPASPGLFDAPDHAVLSWEQQHLYPPANERVLAERATHVTIRPADAWRDASHRLTHLLAMGGSGAQGRRYVEDGRQAR